MQQAKRIAIWLCTKFTREQLEIIVKDVTDVLANRNPDVKPKDDFKEKHPNYREFFVDPNPPLTEPPEDPIPQLDWKQLLKNYIQQKGRPLKPVKIRDPKTKVPDTTICRCCSAPADYLYFNDGKKRRQIKCKVCSALSQVHSRNYLKAKFFCPYCDHPLYLWKNRKDANIYKCPNDKCSIYLSNLKKLNPLEKILRKTKSSQFKLRYQFREYLFTNEQLVHSEPVKMPGAASIFRIRNSLNTLCLALTFHVSLGISGRKTAFILKNVFGINASYQTILNYAQHAAYYCHKFNYAYKSTVENIQAGDETYIKIKGKNGYVFFFISAKNLRTISAYHVADSRDTQPAIIAMEEAFRTADPDQVYTAVTDGNPSYQAGIHFLNSSREGDDTFFLKKVIGLQNLDSESEEFRAFKQIIERLNRTYKYHVRAANGFSSYNGAVVLTTLFVTHYNFIRPHSSLNYNVPVPVWEVEKIPTIQGKWAQIIKMATKLDMVA